MKNKLSRSTLAEKIEVCEYATQDYQFHQSTLWLGLKARFQRLFGCIGLEFRRGNGGCTIFVTQMLDKYVPRASCIDAECITIYASII